MICDDSALPPEAVAKVPPAPPYVLLWARATICRLAADVPATRSAYRAAAAPSTVSSRCTLRGSQPPQKPMPSASRRGPSSEGSQSTPESGDGTCTAHTLT